jgi:23S rRNA pseudouridine1911/1915/1917 synthase
MESHHNAPMMEESQTLEFSVDSSLHLERLDKILAHHIKGFSRSYLQQLIGSGDVFVQNRPSHGLKASQRLAAGTLIRVCLRPTEQAQAFLPEAIPIQWVYRDEDWAVLNKPAGLVVHPAAGNWTGTLLNGLLAADAQLAQLPRAGIVHRLDKDTSGLMLIARTRRGMDALVSLIAQRAVEREYWALVHGSWPFPGQAKTVDAAIGRDPHNRLRMAVIEMNTGAGKPAQTTFSLIKQLRWEGDDYAWLHCKLHTGRTHQIRVHLSNMGYPILADSLYKGRIISSLGMTRQALHAFSLRLPHPITGETMSFTAPAPEDLNQAFQILGAQ